MMLPYLEQAPLYNAANFQLLNQGDTGSYAGYVANLTVSVSRIANFLCPSSPTFPGNLYTVNGVAVTSPGNNYFASVGSSVQWQGTAGNKPNGVFWYNGQPLSNRDVTDGTSNTIAFSEWRTGGNNDGILSVPQDVIEIATSYIGSGTDTVSNNMPAGGSQIQAWLTNCAAQAKSARGRSFIAQQWVTGMFGRTLGNTLLAPNPPYPNCNNTTGNGDFDNLGMFGMSSYHSGGANVAKCDGSVSFLKSSTNPQTVWSLGSRAQGETISADAF